MRQVYFVGCGEELNPVKVGFTSRLTQRISELRSGLLCDLSLMAAVDGGRELERELHVYLRRDCIGGEWFLRSQKMDRFITGLLAGKDPLSLYEPAGARFRAWDDRQSPKGDAVEDAGLSWSTRIGLLYHDKIPTPIEAEIIERATGGVIPAFEWFCNQEFPFDVHVGSPVDFIDWTEAA